MLLKYFSFVTCLGLIEIQPLWSIVCVFSTLFCCYKKGNLKYILFVFIRQIYSNCQKFPIRFLIDIKKLNVVYMSIYINDLNKIFLTLRNKPIFYFLYYELLWGKNMKTKQVTALFEIRKKWMNISSNRFGYSFLKFPKRLLIRGIYLHELWFCYIIFTQPHEKRTWLFSQLLGRYKVAIEPFCPLPLKGIQTLPQPDPR